MKTMTMIYYKPNPEHFDDLYKFIISYSLTGLISQLCFSSHETSDGCGIKLDTPNTAKLLTNTPKNNPLINFNIILLKFDVSSPLINNKLINKLRETDINYKFKIFGILSAIFLAIHSIFLGIKLINYSEPIGV